MPSHFSLRTLFLVVFIVAALLWFFSPVARVSPATCNRIEPGMTIEQAVDIVGAPPGWYDGIGGIHSNSPAYKGPKPSWVNMRGEILVDLDASGHVAQATFYPIEVSSWSLSEYLWERFSRVKYLGLSLPLRVLLLQALVMTSAFIVGLAVIPDNAANNTAWHGLVGLVVAAILAVAVFGEEFLTDLRVTFLAWTSPILGALAGILVGYLRTLLTNQPGDVKL